MHTWSAASFDCLEIECLYGKCIIIGIMLSYRFCECHPSNQLLSPWERVTMWHLESVCDADAKLKDLLNMEWLRFHMLNLNGNKVGKKNCSCCVCFQIT